MRSINVHRSDADPDALVKQLPPDRPPDVTAEPPYTLRDAATGAPVGMVVPTPPALTLGAVSAFHAIPRSTVKRAAGIRTRSNTFGWAGPQPVMQRPTPQRTQWLRDYAALHRPLDDYAAWAYDTLLAEVPEVAPIMDAARASIHPDYRIADTAWTSGIANDTVALHYHHDRNNIPHTWSTMLCARAATRGGNLHIADYDVVVPILDGTSVMFPGVDSVHGVTPLRKSMKHGFRYTMVFYAVRTFVGLNDHATERDRANRRRTELESDLIARQRAEGLLS